MCKIRIGAVVPVYNHPRHLKRLVKHLHEQQLAVILVDDGSTDESAVMIDVLQQEHAERVHVIRHPHNRGKGVAVRSGLLQADALGWSHVLQVDADGQHHWQDIERFVAQAEQHPEHMIIGKPIFDGTISKTRFYGRYATHVWVWINTLSTEIRDSMCGFRVYPVAATCAQIHHHMDERMGFDSEILVYLHWQGVRFINLPTPVTYPACGVSHFLPWSDNLKLGRTHAKLFLGMLWRLPMLLGRRIGKKKKKTMAWQNIQERGNTFCLRVTLLLYKLIGRHLLKCLIAPLVIFWYWLFTPRLRRASRQYLDRITPYLQAAPDKPLSTYRHLLHFAWVFVDKLAGWLGDVSEDELVLQGHEHFRAHYGKGALIITTHFGNMELLRALKADSDQVINVLVYNKHTEHFNRLLKHINPNALVRLISVDELGIDTAMYLQERLDAGEWLMVAADRTPIQSQRTDVLPFFGYDSAWPQGGWLLASLLKCPVMAVFCYPYQGKQHVSIHMLSECFSFPRKERKARLRRIMQDYVTLVEQHCILTPYQWFNFYPFWDEQNPDNETKVVAEHV